MPVVRVPASASFRDRPAAAALVIVALLGPMLSPVAAQQPATPVAEAAATPESSPDADAVTVGTPVVWTQLGTDRTLVARAVVLGECPILEADGRAVAMSVRSGPSGDAFADTVCEAPIPSAADRASIAGTRLALLPDTIDHVAVVGDTGCRVSQWDPLQDCTDAAAWPLRAVATGIAASRPDLIVHIGDYVYRESPCPPGVAACAGSPWGDNQATWQDDVFDPLAMLLPTAPWIFLRGNHESCSREGLGWFRYFAPQPMPTACEEVTQPYAIDLAGLPRLVVMDTGAAQDTKTTADLNETYARQIDAVGNLVEPGSWLLTHKPIAGGILNLGGREQVVTNATIAAVSGNRLPDGIALILSGHIHLAQALLFDEGAGRPTQLVAGHGGTQLDAGETAAYDGALLGDPDLDAAFVGAAFGWMRLDLLADRTTATALDVDGRQLFVVHLAKE